MSPMGTLKRMALQALPAPWIPPLAARVALLFDEAELHLINLLCGTNRVSVDVGANLGIYTEVLRRNSRQVVAVEPNPLLAGRLRRAFVRDVRVVEAALSQTRSRRTLHVPVVQGREVDTRGSLHLNENQVLQTSKMEVDVTTLDELGLEDVGFMKVDVEGHELEVVSGGVRTLRTSRPRMLIEMEERHRPGAVEQVVRALERSGYRGYFSSGQTLVGVSSFDPERHQSITRGKAVGGSRSGLYVNNFIFLAREECGSIEPQLRERLERLGGWTKVRHALTL